MTRQCRFASHLDPIPCTNYQYAAKQSKGYLVLYSSLNVILVSRTEYFEADVAADANRNISRMRDCPVV